MIIYNKSEIDEIVFEMKNNKAIVIPTDTQIGLASIDKTTIYKVKKRSHNKKIVMFIKDLSEVDNPSNNFVLLAKKFWPGKLTLIENGISYRIPNSKICLELLNKIGKFYCSSANISGKEPIQNVFEAEKMFSKNIESIVVVDAVMGDNVASTVYDVDKMKVIRKGIISEDEINGYLQKNISDR